MRAGALTVLMAMVLFSSVASAEVPAVMNYQGTITDLLGVTLDTTVSMSFSIYTDSTGGSPIWTETQTSVEVVHGIFNVLLGRVNPLTDAVFGGSSRWLGVQVESDPEMAPRQRIAAAGYAFQAAEADTAGFARNAVGGTDSDWTIVGGDMYAAVPGFVGIGIAEPQAKLDVNDLVVVRSNTWPSSGAGLELAYDPGSNVGYVQVYDRGAASWGDLYLGDGNVGIGFSSPSYKLHVKGVLGLGNAYTTEFPDYGHGSASLERFSFGDDFGGQDNPILGTMRAVDGSNFYEMAFLSKAYGSTPRALAFRQGVIGSGGEEKWYIGYSGKAYFSDKVGIGTASPERVLHVSSSTSSFGMVMLENSVTGDNEATISFKEGSDAGGADIWVAGVGAWSNTNDFVIGRESAKFLINPSGNVGVGTTTPLELLHLYGTDNPTVRVEAPAEATPELNLKRGTESYSLFLTSENDLSFFKDGTNVTFTDDGKVGIGTNSPSQMLELEGTGPRILVQATAGNPEFNIQASGQTTWAMYQHSEEGDLRFYQAGDKLMIEDGTGNVGIGTTSPGEKLTVRGNLRLESPGSGLPIVELGEGLDYAEGFDVTDTRQIGPGSVLVIDPECPGKLKLCDMSYDGKVAGIVAGGKRQGSGVRLGCDQYDFDVALAGRVYCNVDATYGAVSPGDLLTTSPTPGHAMVVKDPVNALGAVLGKAMEELEAGRQGQILVLVALQ